MTENVPIISILFGIYYVCVILCLTTLCYVFDAKCLRLGFDYFRCLISYSCSNNRTFTNENVKVWHCNFYWFLWSDSWGYLIRVIEVLNNNLLFVGIRKVEGITTAINFIFQFLLDDTRIFNLYRLISKRN